EEKEKNSKQIDIEEQIQAQIQAGGPVDEELINQVYNKPVLTPLSQVGEVEEAEAISTNEQASVSPQCFNEDLSVPKPTANDNVSEVEVDFSQEDSTIAKAEKVLSILKNVDELQPILKDDDQYIALKISLLKGTDEESKKLQSKAVSKLLGHLGELRKEFPT